MSEEVKKFQLIGSLSPAVKTVNGVTPDDNGNIAIEIPEGFSGSWDDLTEKPFGESQAFEPITWDGNTEGLESIAIGEGMAMYRVSERYLPLEQITNGSISITTVTGGEATILAGILNEDYFSSPGGYPMIEEHMWMIGSMILATDGQYELNGSALPKGIWFIWMDMSNDSSAPFDLYYTSALNPPTTITPIPEKYLPETVALKTDIPTDAITQTEVQAMIDTAIGAAIGGSY